MQSSYEPKGEKEWVLLNSEWSVSTMGTKQNSESSCLKGKVHPQQKQDQGEASLVPGLIHSPMVPGGKRQPVLSKAPCAGAVLWGGLFTEFDTNTLLQIRERENFHTVQIWTRGLVFKARKSLQMKYCQIENR